MTKQHILGEIRRMAAANGGVPVGRERLSGRQESFATKRSNGEWFVLDATDIAAFKRRRSM